MIHPFIRRYTDIVSVLDMVKHQRLTLLSPSKWTDQNDREAMELYQARKGKTVVALAMTRATATYHHWHVFAGHAAGAAVAFDASRLISSLNSVRGIFHGPVVYRSKAELEDLPDLPLDELPFLKRAEYADEREYRAIAFLDPDERTGFKHVPLDIGAIHTINASGLMPVPLAQTIHVLLTEMYEGRPLNFNHSDLLGSDRWSSQLQKRFGRPD